jgi:hypothetical protein
MAQSKSQLLRETDKRALRSIIFFCTEKERILDCAYKTVCSEGETNGYATANTAP